METAEATLRAVYPDARNPRAFTKELLEEGFAPHAVPKVWVSDPAPTIFIDTTDVFEQKLAALRSHASQVAKRDADFDIEKLLREWATRIAAMADMDEGRIAEGFRVLDTA